MKLKERVPIIGIFLIILVIGFYDLKKKTDLASNEVTFSKCVDGDTAHFMIDEKDTSVRFLAIDTPETVKPGTPVQPFGKEASAFTCNSLKNASKIKLEYEQGEETDKYGRVLAWIWVDGYLLQKELVSKGYAEVKYIYGDYKYIEELQDIQDYAKSQQKGIWENVYER